MARQDLSNRDASHQASAELEYVMRKSIIAQKPATKRISVEEALNDRRFLEVSSNRNTTRVLFISQNTELINPTTQSLDGYLNISDLFDEVHILLLRQGIPPRNPVLRVGERVWVYTASANFWWQTPVSGFDLVEKQLEFAGGFRPDLVVARDPFESAMTALRLVKKYNCQSQLHILEDFNVPDFNYRHPLNYCRSFLPKYTIPRFFSVRTITGAMQVQLQEKFKISDLSTLPRYQNYTALLDTKLTVDLKEVYRPIMFFMLYIGKLDYESKLYKVMDSARFVLTNPHVGLVVVGDGPARGEFQKRAKMLGIEQQVIFDTKTTNIVPLLKSAQLLLVPDVDEASEELVLKASAVGVPIIMSTTERREDIFTHGESAFLCRENSIQSFADSINIILNDTSIRKQFSLNGREIIRTQFHSNVEEYREAYRTSIEEALFVGEELTKQAPDKPVV